MELLEHLGKEVLRDSGLPTPQGAVARTSQDALQAATQCGGPVVVKSQIPAGKRGKAGAIRFASSPEEARVAAEDLLGSTVSGFIVGAVLIEEQVDISRELYAAVLNDAGTKGPLVLFSTEGGMDIEEVNAVSPELILRQAVDIRQGFTVQDASQLLASAEVELDAHLRDDVAWALAKLYEVYVDVDADLVEVNPLVLTANGNVRALDCKLSLDPGARPRQQDRFARAETSMPPAGTELEQQARHEGFLFIELDGDVAVLANGAGLTMTTLDSVAHYGGRAANFLEIGGDAYTKATPALRLVLSNPRVKSLLVNFCGAFARTDVMTEGVVAAIEELRPDIPISVTIHGTGEERAIQLVEERLGLTPHDLMDDAVEEAVQAASEASR
ncbi:MAG: succinate--CoA ligase [Actinobacteria bacterium]|nr:succinate--CoA ligase [Actinomycetota bacterium]